MFSPILIAIFLLYNLLDLSSRAKVMNLGDIGLPCLTSLCISFLSVIVSSSNCTCNMAFLYMDFSGLEYLESIHALSIPSKMATNATESNSFW